jgi:hypothetical protein
VAPFLHPGLPALLAGAAPWRREMRRFAAVVSTYYLRADFSAYRRQLCSLQFGR